MSNIKKGSKLTVSTANGISRATTTSLGVLEVSGPKMSDVTNAYNSNPAHFVVGATDVSGILQVGINNDGNTFIDASVDNNHKDIILQKYGGNTIFGSGSNSTAKVGIGTTDPGFTRLTVNHSGQNDVNYGLRIHNTYADGNTNRHNLILFTDQNSTQGAIGSFRHYHNTNYQGGLSFFTGSQPTGYNQAAPATFTQATNSITEKMRIQANGNVGIGTTDPGAKLEVKGNALNNGAIYIKSYATTNKTFELKIRDDTTSSYPLHIGPINSFDGININNSNGNVGIGATNPNATLEVHGGSLSGDEVLILSNSKDSAYTGLHGIFHQGGHHYDVYDSSTMQLNNSTSNGAAFHINNYSGGDVSMVVGGGNVGIGTNTPSNNLHIQGVDHCTLLIETGIDTENKTANILFRTDDYDGGPHYDSAKIKSGYYTIDYLDSYICFQTHHTNTVGLDDSMTIRGGNVGIGTTDPSYKLQVSDGSIGITNLHNSSPGLYLIRRAPSDSSPSDSYGGDTYIDWGIYNNGSLNIEGRAIVNSSTETFNALCCRADYGGGNVVIGYATSTPKGQLTIRSNVGAVSTPNSASNAALFIGDGNNGLYLNMGTSGSGTTAAFGLNWNNNGSHTDVDNALVLRNDSGENRVGIGTMSPNGTLNVYKNGNGEGMVQITGTSDMSLRLQCIRTDSNDMEVYYEIMPGTTTTNSWKMGTNDDKNLHFAWGNIGSMNNQEIVTILNTGNVGIGTTSPNERLHIQDVNDTTLKIESGNNTSGKTANILFRTDDNGTAQAHYDAAKIVSGFDSTPFTSSYISFQTHNENNANWFTSMKIKGGNVGIGTTSPNERLHVIGNAVFQQPSSSTDYTSNSTHGINLIPYGGNSGGNAGGRIFFDETVNGVHNYGFTLGYNGGGDSAILNWKSNTFNINRHSNSDNGLKVISIDRDTSEFNSNGVQIFSDHPTSSTDNNLGTILSFRSPYISGIKEEGGFKFVMDDTNDGTAIYPRLSINAFQGSGVLWEPNAMTFKTTSSTNVNVGIGTTDPGSYKLNVNGNTKLQQTYVSKIVHHQHSGTGIWFDTADTLRFIINNKQRMIFDDNGRLGIGHNMGSTPICMLDISCNLNTTGINVKGAGVENNGKYQFILRAEGPDDSTQRVVHFLNGSNRTDDGGANTYVIRNDYGNLELGHSSYDTIIKGNVGIGTSDPGTYRLSVQAGRSHFYYRQSDGVSEELMNLIVSTNVNGHSVPQLQIESTPRGYHTTYATIQLKGSEAGSQSWRPVNYGCGIRARGGYINREYADLSIWTTNSSTNTKQDVMTINSAGNVGIGTTSPYCLLQVGSLGAGGNVYSETKHNRIAFPSHSHSNNRYLFANRDPDNDTACLDIHYVHDNASGNKHLMTFNNQGNVGIGTTAPSAKLDVGDGKICFSGNIHGGEGGISYHHEGSTTERDILFFNTDGSTVIRPGDNSSTDGILFQDYNGNDRMFIKNNGNVGIGTVVPGTKLHVYGDQGFFLQGDQRPCIFYYKGATNGGTLKWVEGMNSTTDENYRIEGLNSAGDILLLPTGNVGIGTTNPNYTFEIEGQLGMGYNLGGTALFGYKSLGTTSSTSYTRGHEFLNANGNTMMSIIHYGTQYTYPRVGIGYNAPIYNLDVNGTGRFINHLRVEGSSAQASGDAHIYVTKSTNNDWSFYANHSGYNYGIRLIGNGNSAFRIDEGATNRINMQYNGWTGIHITNPGYPLDIRTSTSVSGQAYWWSRSRGWAGYNQNYTATASIHITGGIWVGDAVAAASDRRIKKNITDVPDHEALNMVRNIPCRYYEYRDQVMKRQGKIIGFIAQEVKEVFPLAVTVGEEFIPNEMRRLENVSWEKEEIYDSSGVKYKYKLTCDLSDCSGVNYKFYVSNDPSGNDEEMFEVMGNQDETFTFDNSWNNVYCYGKEVDDFHLIDKQKIFALNFSATQEIDRIQQQEITKVQTLQTDLSNANTIIQTLQTDLSNANTTIQQQATTIQEQATKITTLETQIADILTRLSNLENTGSA